MKDAISSQCCKEKICKIFDSPTLSHVLCDYVDRLLRHHSVELNQLLVPQLLHDLSFLEEGLGGHGAGLQRLYCHPCCTVPCSWEEIKNK